MHNAPFVFSEAPFKTTPDPRFYYSNQTFKTAWATLRFGIEARKGLIVITGEPGTGKTTLLKKALHAFNPKIKAAYVSDALVAGNELLRPILADLALGDSKENRSAMMKRLADFLFEQFQQGNIVALMIDEAQKMSLEAIEELRCLGNLETEKDKLLQIVLAGQPELEQRLDEPELRQLKQRIVLRCRLKPIAHNEVQAYMDSRLCMVGYRSEDLFEQNAIEKIASFSSGIPRLINVICDNALLAAYSRSAQKVSDFMIDAVAENLRLGKSGKEERLQALTYSFEQNTAPTARRRERDAVAKQHSPLALSHLNAILRWLGSRTGISVAIVLLSVLTGFLYSLDLRLSVSDTRSGFVGEEKTKKSNETEIAIAKSAARIPDAPPKKTDRLSQDSQQARPLKTKDLFVIEDSFVRAQPSPNAKIIATLTPGTRIQVTGPTGAYYGVRSRGTKTIRGYVHKEDAFFDAKSETR
jgi:type II secretory pathway predicted ATPase ExeA